MLHINLYHLQAYIDESISTCRFAQRVAMVSNTATVNEETDPTLVIKALKQQVRELKDQVKLLQVCYAHMHPTLGPKLPVPIRFPCLNCM
jgi:hypothetical protein